MAKKTGLTVNLRIEGARQVLASFRDLPKEATVALRDASQKIAAGLVPDIKAAAESDSSPQSRLLASTVKVRRDRVPSVQAGGSTRLGRHKAPAYSMLWGSEFGMTQRSGWYARPRYDGETGLQYGKRHQGTTGSWFFPTVEAKEGEIGRGWLAAADEIVHQFNQGA